MPLTQVSPGLLDSNAQYYGFKNRLINGGFSVAQRGTSFSSLGSGAVAYGLDRWFAFRGAYAANLNMSQQAGFSGLPYCMRIQRTSGTSGTQAMVFGQVIESINMLDLAGQTITFSVFMRSGANYSGGAVNMDIYSSTALNQTSAGLAAGSWTGLTTVASQAKTITSTGTLYTVTATVPANAQSLGVEIYWYPTGTAGAADFIEITGIQLEVGSTATSFDYRPYGTELALCQRYYEILVNNNSGYSVIGVYRGASDYRSTWYFKVDKRALPSISLYSGATWATATPTIYPSTTHSDFYASNTFYPTGTSVPVLQASAEL